MPIKLAECSLKSLKDRVDAFRKTIPDEVGYTVAELTALPAVAGNATAIGVLLRELKWGILLTPPGKRQPTWTLMNPKTLQKYAGKT